LCRAVEVCVRRVRSLLRCGSVRSSAGVMPPDAKGSKSKRRRFIYVGRNLRTGSVCKLRLSVCRLDVLKVQFVDCTPHKPGLQTGTQFANCVNPVCKLDKSSFRGLVCKWEIIGNELLAQTASRRSASATHAATRAARTAATTTELQAASFGQPGW
jgi:hypothetical protein